MSSHVACSHHDIADISHLALNDNHLLKSLVILMKRVFNKLHLRNGIIYSGIYCKFVTYKTFNFDTGCIRSNRNVVVLCEFW